MDSDEILHRDKRSVAYPASHILVVIRYPKCL